VMHIIDCNDKTIGLIYNYACHACTVMLNQYSADYPGVTSALLENKLGGAALFFPGACGNIHPINEWLSPDGIFSYPHSEDKNNAVEKNGSILADKVLNIVQGTNKYEDVIIKSIKNQINLSVRNVENIGVDHIEKQLRIRKLDDKSIKEHLEVYKLELDELKKKANTYINTVVQVIKIDNYAIVGVPAEMFVEYGLEIKEKSPFKYTFVCENANDCIGYTPTKEAFKLGGYQTWAAKSSGLSPESGDIIVQTVVKMLLAL
jgi:neutral ceramidase